MCGLNGQEVRCSFALASRVKNYGGDLSIARNASLFSDDFEVVLFQGAHSLPYMKYLIGCHHRASREHARAWKFYGRSRLRSNVRRIPGSMCRSTASLRAVCRRGSALFRMRLHCWSPRVSTQASAMDNLTHTLTGVMLARAGLDRLTPRAMCDCGDCGQYSRHRCRQYRSAVRPTTFTYHRWATHSLAFAPVDGDGAGAGCRSDLSTARLPWFRAWLVALVAIASHLLLDFTNPYGIRLLLPFLQRMARASTLRMLSISGSGRFCCSACSGRCCRAW